MILSDHEFKLVYLYILNNYGIDLSKKKFLIESKLTIELNKRNIDSFNMFWKLFNNGKNIELQQMLIDALTTNYSYFYREKDHFEYIKDNIIKEFDKDSNLPLYFWCAGCATGQEVYSLAMQLMDCCKDNLLKRGFVIHGSDVSSNALDKAKKASYSIADYVRMPASWQTRYCLLGHGGFEVKSIVKDNVRFFKANLFEKPKGLIKYHVVFCRNVLIYFNDETRHELVKNLCYSLKEGGYLIISHCESIKIDDLPLEYVMPSIYRKIKG